jgi:polysaccharide pyruvyl transferase csaB
VAYRKALAGALAALHQSHQVEVLFIPMSHPEDTEEAKTVAAYMGNAPYVHLLEESFTTSQFLELAGAVDIMIGVRLHALVFASLMGKPVVGISYDPKIDAFLHMIEQEAMGTMERLDQDKLYARLVDLLEGKGDYQHSFDRIESLRKISFRSAQLALALLKQ